MMLLQQSCGVANDAAWPSLCYQPERYWAPCAPVVCVLLAVLSLLVLRFVVVVMLDLKADMMVASAGGRNPAAPVRVLAYRLLLLRGSMHLDVMAMRVLACAAKRVVNRAPRTPVGVWFLLAVLALQVLGCVLLDAVAGFMVACAGGRDPVAPVRVMACRLLHVRGIMHLDVMAMRVLACAAKGVVNRSGRWRGRWRSRWGSGWCSCWGGRRCNRAPCAPVVRVLLAVLSLLELGFVVVVMLDLITHMMVASAGGRNPAAPVHVLAC